ncbi:MAG: matrixin family metalloprotease [Candidatus Woesearchaeota archaeon]
MDYVMKGTVNYEKTSSKDNADLVIEVRDDLDDYTAGVIKEVDRTSNNRITYAKIHLNKRNMATSGVDVTAHEIGHSLGISHSAEKEHLMYSGSEVDMDTWKEEETKEKWIFGLLYSLPHPTQNPFAD